MRAWAIGGLCLALASTAAWAQPVAASAASSAAAKAPAAAASIKVKVLFAETAGQPAKPAAGAVVRLKGAEQTFATNAAGVAEVFGHADAKSVLTVIVVNAAICNLPLAGRKGSITVLVPRKGQGKCQFQA